MFHLLEQEKVQSSQITPLFILIGSRSGLILHIGKKGAAV